MKQLFVVPLTLVLTFASVTLSAQIPIEIKRDNGTPSGHRTDAGWEESVILAPGGPARLLELKIYYRGGAGVDTVHICGDPAEGYIPPTSHVWSYNDLTPPIPVVYDGVPGWRTFDLRDRGLRVSGHERVVIQHRIDDNNGASVGPAFAYDNQLGSPYASFLYDPIAPSGLGFPGKYWLANGDFLVRLVVEYERPKADGSSQTPPTAALVDRTAATGLTLANAAVKSSRVSVADWNGDGFDDIAAGSTFFQNDGDGTFSIAPLGISAGATVWGDYDNDGKLDVYAANGGAGDALWRNNGDGTFTNVTSTAGISNPSPTVTPIWLDMDRDGRLDLFIANGRTEANGQEQYFRDVMWRNNGDGTFSDVSVESGIAAGEPEPPYDTWGASATDYNQDGNVDIHVATYRLAPDLLFRGSSNGTFTEVAAEVGVQGVETASPQYFGHGIGTDWGDYNNDGYPDLAVGNLGHPDWRGRVSNPSLVFRNDGPPNYTFTEVHDELGIKFFEMNAGVVWLDLDNDGYLDLWHCQYAYNPPGGNEPTRRSRMYMNGGPAENFRFSDATWQLGSSIHGAWTAARGDFDRDGRMDLVVASPHAGVRLFHNELASNGTSIAFRLVGSPSASVPLDGVGTRMTVHAGGRKFYRELMGEGTGTTASQNSNLLHFGLGDVDVIDSVVVNWPNGTIAVLSGPPVVIERELTLTYPRHITKSAITSVGAEHVASPLAVSSVRFADGAIMLNLAGASQDGSIVVTNLLGRPVASGTVDGRTDVQRIALDVAPPSGTYIVRVTSGRWSAAGRLVITR